MKNLNYNWATAFNKNPTAFNARLKALKLLQSQKNAVDCGLKQAQTKHRAFTNLNSNVFGVSAHDKILFNRFSKITRDQYKRANAFKQELEKILLRGLLSSVHRFQPVKQNFNKNLLKQTCGEYELNLKTKAEQNLKFARLNLVKSLKRKFNRKKTSFTRIRNRCVLTAHPHTVGKLGVSRIVFRSLAGFGQVPGLEKL